ncbi:YceD family protein [Chelativorans sp. YIM 93263]|uniref:YceD family protein n=1 Tax=Chelativorans sp. YIM 93263 TaxID=2906648 RepID=UPI002378EF00|nr:DUF177 domain-containing protein [Chelativorans sp. YIM 93263]
MAHDIDKSPVSFEMKVGNLPASGTTITIDAAPSQRAEMSRLHDVLSVERFHAELTVRPWKKDGVRVTGDVEADITQACVVTLEPLAAHINEPVTALFVPDGSRLARMGRDEGEIVLEAEGEDPPEPFEGDTLDLGAVAEEFFALAIDPYPRKGGAPLQVTTEEKTEEVEAGPLYEKLKKLRRSGG